MPRTPSNLSEAPKRRKTTALDNALGNRPTTNPSPEGAAQGWRTVKIGDIAAEVRYGSSSKTEDNADGVPVIRMGNIINGALDFTKLKYLPSEHPEFPLLLLEPGDILFNRTNSAELVGKTAVYRGYPKKCSFASYLIRVRLREGIPEWVSYYLNSSFGRAWIKTVVSQQCGQANVNGSKLKDLEIPFPPVEEQRRIVARIEELFSRLDAGVAALRHAKAQLQRYRQSVLAAAVTGQLTQTWRERSLVGGQSENGTPCGWSVSTVADAIKIIDYRGRTPPYAESGIPHIRSANIKNGKIVWEKMKYVTSETYNQYMTRGIPQQGDLLFTTEAPLGDVTEVPMEKFCLAQRVILLRPDPNELSHKFLKYQIMAPDFQGRISGRGTGSTVAGISSRNFKPVPIVLPPIAEQHQIVAEVEARTTAIDHLEAELDCQITRSNRLRQSTLSSAFAGLLQA